MYFIHPKRKNYQVLIPPLTEARDFTPQCLRTQLKTNIVISTVERPKSYIHQTLASLFLGGFPNHFEIHLAVCGTNANYLKNYFHHKNLKIHTLKNEEFEKIQNWSTKYKANYNYFRCMNLGQFENSLIIEDDVIFQDQWFQKFLTCLTQIENDGYERYFISLLTPGIGYSEKFYFSYPKMGWAGSQCIFYPQSILPELREFILNCTCSVQKQPVDPLAPSYANAYDMLVKEYSMGNDISIFCPIESLVQHVGHETVNSGSKEFLVSPCFTPQQALA